MGEELADEERKDLLLRKLLQQQHMLRTVAESAQRQADLVKEVDAPGFCLAIHMLRESLLVYSSELSKFVMEHIGAADE